MKQVRNEAVPLGAEDRFMAVQIYKTDTDISMPKVYEEARHAISAFVAHQFRVVPLYTDHGTTVLLANNSFTAEQRQVLDFCCPDLRYTVLTVGEDAGLQILLAELLEKYYPPREQGLFVSSTCRCSDPSEK